MIDLCSVEPKALLSVDEALTNIKSAIKSVIATEQLALNCAQGRVLSEDVFSPINIPYDRNSAMDGYAFSSKDIDAMKTFPLSLVGTSWAGKPFQASLEAGQCVRIFTGAVVPDKADSVVIQEQVIATGEKITFPVNCAAHKNIREIGEDVMKGSLLCPRQKKLMPADLSLLAAAGITDVPVHRKINIAFFSTGDELVGLGEGLGVGKIYDSNRYLLSGLLVDPCYNALDMGVMPDDKQLLEDTIRAAAETNDVIISTGGASVGDADYVKSVLDNCGTVSFWKVAIKPGKPLAFGKIGPCYFFGLPGNPVAVMVTFRQFVAPALKQLSGAAEDKPLRILATCASDLKKVPGRQEFQRGILMQDANGNFFVSSAGQQGSNIISSMSRSNCSIILPKDCNGVKSGEQVWVEPFSVFI